MPKISIALAFTAAVLLAGPVAAQNLDRLEAARTDTAGLVAAIQIPYEAFELDNGLRVVVHTDHSAPQVFVGVYYKVGAKDEPIGRSGFAHLFEHLMFSGSENVTGHFFQLLQEAGAGDINGGTTPDRTQYYEVVPTGALERALFMESDRMGHLLGALNQKTLDEQRGVVQNEKRQGQNNPYGVIRRLTERAIYPAGHPYAHGVIGSMADLDAAGLPDVEQWFRTYYGPNNALIVLAGDIDPARARELVTTYFGDIPRGPETASPRITVTELSRSVRESATSPVTEPVVVRAWPVPGQDSAEAQRISVLAGVMGGVENAALKTVLVDDRKLFSSISVANESRAQAGIFSITGTVAQGVDADEAAAALDAEIERVLLAPPAAATLERWMTPYLVGYAQGLEALGQRGGLLASGALISGDPQAYRRDLAEAVAQTPASIHETARRWLTRPNYGLTVRPGPTTVVDEATPALAPLTQLASSSIYVPQARPMSLPGVGDPTDVVFPRIERGALSNGMPVVLVHRDTTPMTLMMMSFDGGSVRDPIDKIGLQAVMTSMMNRGAAGRSAEWINEVSERLGLSVGAGATQDSSSVLLMTPSVNLEPALDLTEIVVKSPDFPQNEFERIKAQRLAMIDRERANPEVLADRAMSVLRDAASPYAARSSAGDAAAVAALTKDDLTAAWKAWIRPQSARIVVVSDLDLSVVTPLLDARFGAWEAAGEPGPARTAWTPAPASPQILLIDHPDATQAIVRGGQRIPLPSDEDMLALTIANRTLGGGFLSRINQNIREEKHWTYGASSSVLFGEHEAGFELSTSVQQDKAGPAIAEMIRETREFLGDAPLTQAEFDLSINGDLRGMGGWLSSTTSVLAALNDKEQRGRPDDFFTRLPEQYRSLTRDRAMAAFRAVIDPDAWSWVVVGDAAVLRPQLEALGLPVRTVDINEADRGLGVGF